MDRGRNYAKRISSGLRFAIAGLLALLALSLSAIHQVIAAPVEYFYLQANVQDAAAPYSFGVMDAHDANGALTGFIQLNEPAASDYQLWAELADNAGVHIQNKATGLCIGDTIGNSGTATLLSCNLGETLWREVPHGPGPKSVAFQRTTKLSWPSSDIEVCLGKDRDAPSTANVYGCSKTISDYEVWTATNEPIGTASAGVTPTPPPPVVPAVATDRMHGERQPGGLRPRHFQLPPVLGVRQDGRFKRFGRGRRNRGST